MKTISTQLSFFFQDTTARRNLSLLWRYMAFLAVVIALYTVLFHLIMWHVEGRDFSWITGLYWTLTVMSTLGFGDITFESDIGRLFSIVVLMSGIMLLLIVLPFAFISYFYAPWLEAQMRQRAPRELPEETAGHVVLSRHDAITDDLIPRLQREDIPYVLLEPDASTASHLHGEGRATVIGSLDDRATCAAVRAERARLVLVNGDDMANTNAVLTLREVAPDVPIAAIARDRDAIDILELSGATHVLPLKQWLGEQLANRVHARHTELLPIGKYEDLLLAELPLHNTPLAGRTIRETGLREHTGVSIIAVWERGVLTPARPGRTLTDACVPAVIGTQAQLDALNELIAIYDVNPNPVLVIGGGTVGTAAVRALHGRDVPVHLIERDPVRCERLRPLCEAVFPGDAADYDLLEEAGIKDAPSVLLSTNSDSINIYLTAYCRRLNPELRIVSRITRARNLEAIHRAGADFVLSYASLGVEAVMAIVKNKDLVVMGEGADLISRHVPPALDGKTLAESEIGARTGLNVVALAQDGAVTTHFTAETTLDAGAELVMVGTDDQLHAFVEAFE